MKPILALLATWAILLSVSILVYKVYHLSDFSDNLIKCAHIWFGIKHNNYTGKIDNFCYDNKDIILFSDIYPPK